MFNKHDAHPRPHLVSEWPGLFLAIYISPAELLHWGKKHKLTCGKGWFKESPAFCLQEHQPCGGNGIRADP